MHELEHIVFMFVNQQATGPLLDLLMMLLSSERLWLVLGLGVGAWIMVKGSWQRRRVVFALIVALTICDSFSYRVLKPYFDRQRPCYQEEQVRLVADGCGSNYGFPSNHASNGMTAACLLYLFSRQRQGAHLPTQRLRWPFGLVLAVGYSRIYVGVHYPGDVLFGYGVGALIAFAVYGLWQVCVPLSWRGPSQVKG